MNKLLKVFQRNLGSEGRASQILEVIGTVGPGANDIAIKLPQLVRNALRQPPTATGYFVLVFPGSHVVIVGESKDTWSLWREPITRSAMIPPTIVTPSGKTTSPNLSKISKFIQPTQLDVNKAYFGNFTQIYYGFIMLAQIIVI
jgi:hypothetical protein